MLSSNVNYLAVLVAAVINMVVGALWYSKAMFAKPWMKLTGKKMEDMNGAASGYAIAMVGALVQAFVMANLVRDVGAATVGAGATLGFLLWLAFTGITSAVTNVFSGNSWKLWQINTGYFLVVLVVNGALLAVWR